MIFYRIFHVKRIINISIVYVEENTHICILLYKFEISL